MDVLTDGLLLAASLFAGGYCWVLARRVRDLKSLDTGLGGAIVTLTRQIELARATLDEARQSATSAHDDLGALIARADAASGELKLVLASARAAGAGRPPAREDMPPAAPSREPAPPTAPADPAPAVRADVDSDAAPRRLADIAALFAAEEAPPAPAPASEPAAVRPAEPAEAAGPPKPRALPPIANPLRRREPVAPVRSEDELMDLLSSMAAGAR